MGPLCILLNSWVLFCDPAAQEYADPAASVPPGHRRLTEWIGIASDATASASNVGLVLLPAERDDGTLYHEAGHPVALAYDNALGKLFELIFWYEGRPRCKTPSASARPSPAEDFAESYRAFIERSLERCCPERARWMRETVPWLASGAWVTS